MNIDVGLLSIAVALVALWLETKRSRISTQADMLIRLADRFTNDQMKKIRKKAAKNILSGNKTNEELSDLLNSFTIISLLVKDGALDFKLAYSTFEYWLTRYWYASLEYIEQQREIDPEVWHIVEIMVHKFGKLNKRNGYCQPLNKEALIGGINGVKGINGVRPERRQDGPPQEKKVTVFQAWCAG